MTRVGSCSKRSLTNDSVDLMNALTTSGVGTVSETTQRICAQQTHEESPRLGRHRPQCRKNTYDTDRNTAQQPSGRPTASTLNNTAIIFSRGVGSRRIRMQRKQSPRAPQRKVTVIVDWLMFPPQVSWYLCDDHEEGVPTGGTIIYSKCNNTPSGIVPIRVSG